MNQVRASRQSIIYTTSILVVITFAARVLGFGRWLGQSWTIGANEYSELYAGANMVPNILFELFAGGILATAIVPVVVKPLAIGDEKNARRSASALITWAGLFASFVAIFLFILAPLVARLLVGSGYAQIYAEQIELTTYFLRVFAWQIPFYAVAVVAGGILQGYKKFILPTLAPIISSVVILGVYIGTSVINNWHILSINTVSWNTTTFLAWGTTAAVVAMTLPQIVYCLLIIGYKPVLVLPVKVRKQIWQLLQASFLTILVQQLAALGIILLCNWLGQPGSYNLYQYAQAVYLLPSAVLAIPLATVYAPEVVKLFQAGEKLRLQTQIAKVHYWIGLLATFSVATLVASSGAITQVFSWRSSLIGLEQSIWGLAPGAGLMVVLAYDIRILFALDKQIQAAKIMAYGWLVSVIFTLIGYGLWDFIRLPKNWMGNPVLWFISVGVSVGNLYAVYKMRTLLAPFITTIAWRFLALLFLGAMLIATITNYLWHIYCTHLTLGWAFISCVLCVLPVMLVIGGIGFSFVKVKTRI